MAADLNEETRAKSEDFGDGTKDKYIMRWLEQIKELLKSNI